MKSRKFVVIGIVVVTLVLVGLFINSYFFQKEVSYVEFDRFELDKSSLKITMSENESTSEIVTIANLGGMMNFIVNINGIDDVELSETEFELNLDEKKTLDILFNSSDFAPGIYLGNLEISAGGDVENLPIVLEIQSRNVYFDANTNLFPGGKVAPGQRLNAELKLFDLGRIGRSNIELSYYVGDFSENIIAFETEEIVIDSRSTITKTVDLPTDLEVGDYVFYIILRYEDSVGTSSVLFKVAESEEGGAGGGVGDSELNMLWIIISVFGFFFLVIVLLFVYTIFSRDRLLYELQSQYKSELRRQNKLIMGEEKISYKKLKTPVEKKEYKKQVKVVREKRIKAIKEIHKKRVNDFNKIKKDGKTTDLKKQMNLWKKKGYDTNVLEERFKLPDVGTIRKKISKWKKQGYDTSILEKRLKK